MLALAPCGKCKGKFVVNCLDLNQRLPVRPVPHAFARRQDQKIERRRRALLAA
jgi:hypothetical protein